jgi:hypothetical protein
MMPGWLSPVCVGDCVATVGGDNKLEVAGLVVDLNRVLSGLELSDMEVNAAQRLLREQYHCSSLQDTLLGLFLAASL